MYIDIHMAIPRDLFHTVLLRTCCPILNMFLLINTFDIFINDQEIEKEKLIILLISEFVIIS
jgi:hypothetical protein